VELDQAVALFGPHSLLGGNPPDGSGHVDAQVAGAGRLDPTGGDVHFNDRPLLDPNRLGRRRRRGEPVHRDADRGNGDDAQKPVQTIGHRNSGSAANQPK
jgi:hypothetical protein